MLVVDRYDTNMLNILILVMLSLSPAYRDTETWADRVDRITTVGEVIDDVSAEATCSGEYAIDGCRQRWPGDQRDLAYLLIEQADTETHLARNVHEGNCWDDECDSYRMGGIVHWKSHSLWQVQRSGPVSQAAWDQMVGVDFRSTKVAAVAATRILINGWNLCHSIHGAVGVYAGPGCRWSEGPFRERKWSELKALDQGQLESRVLKRKTAVICHQTPDSIECLCLKRPAADECLTLDAT